jgi:hypothetical protein
VAGAVQFVEPQAGGGYTRKSVGDKSFGSPRLVPRKVVTCQQDTLQRRMIRIHTGVNIRDDSAAAHSKLSLGLRYMNDSGRRLIRIAIPYHCAEVIYQRIVCQRRRCRRHRVQPADQAERLVQLRIYDSRQGSQNRQQHIRIEQRSHKEYLA